MKAIYFIDATAKGYGQWHRRRDAIRDAIRFSAANPLGVPVTVCGLPTQGSLSFDRVVGVFCARCWPETVLRDYFRQRGVVAPRVLTNEEIEERVLNTIALKTAVVPTYFTVRCLLHIAQLESIVKHSYRGMELPATSAILDEGHRLGLIGATALKVDHDYGTGRPLADEEVQQRLLNALNAPAEWTARMNYGTGPDFVAFAAQAAKAVVILRKSQAWLVEALTTAWAHLGASNKQDPVMELGARSVITKLIEPSKVAAENVLNKAREWKLIE